MRILIAGANGLLGSRTCEVLVRQGASVVGASRGPRRASGSWAYESCDFTEPPQIVPLFDKVKPDVVINCVAMTHVDACEKDAPSSWRGNLTTATAIAVAAHPYNSHMVQVSTDYVFDGAAGPYDEDAPAKPASLYGITKQAAEQAVQAYLPSVAIARTSVLYGWPPGAQSNFGSWLVQTLERGQRVGLFEDQITSPTWAWNAAEMIAELATRRLTGTWNVSGAEAVDRVTFGRRLCEVFELDAHLIDPVRLADGGLTATRPLKGGLKTTKAQAQLHAKPLGLTDALRRFRDERRSAA